MPSYPKGTRQWAEAQLLVLETMQVDCIPARQCKSKWAYGHDGYCWILESPTALEVPIACKGASGLFDPPRLTFGGQP